MKIPDNDFCLLHIFVHMKEHPYAQTCTKEEEVKTKEEEMSLLSSYSCLLIALRGKSTSAIETKLRF